MPSPFPGMDPYLESPSVWRDFHHRLITSVGDALTPQVTPGYYVAIEERAYIMEVHETRLVGLPDLALVGAPPQAQPAGSSAGRTAVAVAPQVVTLPLFEEVRESYLEIRDTPTHEVVTVIEVLSPTNKVPGIGRREYGAKRRQVLAALTNLVEIDLLRCGEPMEMQPRPSTDYRILVRAGWERANARLYSFAVRQPIPEVEVPLRMGEQEARLAIGELLPAIYDRARYDLRLDYSRPPEPPLTREDAAWADGLLRASSVGR